MRELKVPIPESSYGYLRVAGPPLRVSERKKRRADGTVVVYGRWRIPCICELCGNSINILWDSLRSNSSTRCNACRQAAASLRMTETAEFLARRRDKYPWHHKGDGYLYVISYGTILKIGYSTSRPGVNVACSNARFLKYTGKEMRGVMAWHQAGTVTDEAIIQGICNKVYGSVAFPNYHGGYRVSEWINCPDLEAVLSDVKDAYKFARSL